MKPEPGSDENGARLGAGKDISFAKILAEEVALFIGNKTRLNEQGKTELDQICRTLRQGRAVKR